MHQEYVRYLKRLWKKQQARFRQAVHRANPTGPASCERCGEGPTSAYGFDPRHVIWLCRPCRAGTPDLPYSEKLRLSGAEFDDYETWRNKR
jgi:hypothetical protein